MKSNLFVAAAVAAAGLASALPGAVFAADRVGDFSLLDQDGYHHSMSWYDDHKSIALLVQANDSAATDAAVADFAQLKAGYEDAGIEFFMINPMGRGNRSAVQTKLAEYGVDIPVLMDDARVISEELGIERTGEVVLFSPSSFEVEYRGSLAGAQAAIDEILAGAAVSVAMTETNGSMVSYEQMASVPSYSQDIAPILAENCASCHREGGIAPFAMDSHTMVKGWSPMIREVLMTKRMPPGQIDGHIGDFINDMRIEDQEVRNIIAWVEAGAPKDDANDPLAELMWPETKWAFGEPDYIIKVPAQSVPATGTLDYRDVAVTIDIPEDRWLRGSQYTIVDDAYPISQFVSFFEILRGQKDRRA